ncbi:hypothetical protein M1403_02760 [Patescibacteria group bacterium]|nr:hypothetical protein [Patescibacteria group bacterium]
MEQHAVPQDITGFKFKLVGDMTLKQFGELAGGTVIAYLFFASNWNPLLKWPGVLFFGFLGFALAFLPIEERPLDIWIVNFLKAIYQPTLYVWKKGAVTPAFTSAVSPNPGHVPTNPQPAVMPWPFTEPQPATKPAAPTPPPPVTPASQPAAPMPQVSPGPVAAPPAPKPEAAPSPKPSAIQPQAPFPAAQNGPTISIEDLQKLRDQKMAELQGITKRMEKAQTDLKADLYKAQNGPRVVTVDDLARRRDEKKQADETQLQSLLEENTKLISEIESIKTRIQALAGSDTTQLQTQLNNLTTSQRGLSGQISLIQTQLEGKKPEEKPVATQPTPDNQVKVVEKPVAREASISLTDVPNIINGTVTNETGVPLDSAILIIKDKAGNSIRALKTNQIGQFIASTPLENGTYYLEFERQGYVFDVLEITLNGKVIQPLEIHGRHS